MQFNAESQGGGEIQEHETGLTVKEIYFCYTSFLSGITLKHKYYIVCLYLVYFIPI